MILHLALPADWEQAQKAGEYLISTRGRTLAEEGFIHCSRDLDQARGVAQAFYSDVLEGLLVLHIEESGLEVRVEDGFPHVYGPLPLTSVIRVSPWRRTLP